MEISVIVPTYNGVNKLKNILDCLKKQSIKEYELIVSIDGSTDESYDYVYSRKSEFLNLLIINESNGGRSVCRNRAAKLAKGDLLIFLDDDMRPNPNLIQQHLNKHIQYLNSIVVGGQIEEISKCKTDIQKYKAFLSRKWSNVSSEKLTEPYITAANFSISKKMFWELGAFDERLTDAEDYDLAITAFESKIPIYLVNSILAWHDDFISCKSYIYRLRQYSDAQIKLEQLKPEFYLNKYNFRNTPKLSKIKSLFFYLFVFRFWVVLIDKEYLSLLPEKVKYKIYDFVITSLGVYYKHKKI